MADLPPLPAGFALDSAQPAAASQVPPLPPGFQLDTFSGDALLSDQSMQSLASGQQSTVTPTPEPSMLENGAKYAGDYASGLERANNDYQRAVAGGSSPMLGGIEALATLATGAASPLSGFVGGALTKRDGETFDQAAERSAKASIYQPRSAAGKATLQSIGAFAKPVTDLAESTGADMALAPLANEMQGLNAIPRVPKVPAKARTAEDVLARMQPGDSVGAASSSPGIGNLSPELKQAVVKAATKTGGAVNREALLRHMDADSLPVPVRLTEGMATQDPTRISHEMNLRGRSKDLTDRFSEVNRSLADNVRSLRDEAGPDVFTTNATEHGDTLIAAYKAKDDLLRKDINAKYKALSDANGGSLPVDGGAFVTAAADGLKKQMKAPFLPGPIKQIMTDLRKGEPMTIESFENLRTALAAEGRKADRAGDGNAAAAVSIVRDALESVPMSGGSAQVKALADEARKASRSRFTALRDDPAYKAAVDDAVTPDRFVQKYIINGSRDDVEKLMTAIQGDQTAEQTVRVAVLDYLRDQARLSPTYEGNFSSAGFSKALKQLDPKLRHLLPADALENVEKLGRVARYSSAQPKGSFVNNSNTFVAQAADYGSGAAEGAINVAFGGIPVGTWGRKLGENALRKRESRNALAPGAGLDRLEK